MANGDRATRYPAAQLACVPAFEPSLGLALQGRHATGCNLCALALPPGLGGAARATVRAYFGNFGIPSPALGHGENGSIGVVSGSPGYA